jgi:hypothetical protein
VGGGFTGLGGQTRNYLGRLNADGTVDGTFNPGADGYVSSLAVQADGKVLAGGTFSALGGQPRNCIGRLNNTEPASQSLSSDDSTITWLRGGTSPEVWRTTFDCSTNGMDWTALGEGHRITGGWQMTGLSLPSSGTLRARGHVTGGQYNGSSWFVETMSLLSPSAVVLGGGTPPGFSGGEFGSDIAGPSGQIVLIEASTNLQTWLLLWSNALGPGPLYFSDPDSGSISQRFYRARLWP